MNEERNFQETSLKTKAAEQSLRSAELLDVFLNGMSRQEPFSVIGKKSNPCHIKFGDTEFYVYVKNISSAYFANRDVSRSQLSGVYTLGEIKESSATFLLLGYDAENRVFATWNPHITKGRIGTAKSPSLYSRFSWQKEARALGDIVQRELKNGESVVISPVECIELMLKNIWNYFEDISPTSDQNGTFVGEQTDYESKYVNEGGILTRITNPKLLDLLRKDLDTDYPSFPSAYSTIEEFYADRFPNMSMRHWNKLFNDIRLSFQDGSQKTD